MPGKQKKKWEETGQASFFLGHIKSFTGLEGIAGFS